MSVNLISLASQYLTPDILAKIGSMLGVDKSVIGKACSAAIPALFGHFAKLSSTPDGARRLYDAVNQQNTDILGNLSRAIGGSAQGAAEGGVSSLRSLLGGSALPSLTGALGRFAGFPQSSASSLLGMLAPIAMAILGKQSAEQGLNPAGLTDLLAAQKDHIAAAMPSGFKDMLQQSGANQGARVSQRPSGFDAGRVQPSPQRSWAWVILPLIAAGLIGWWLVGNRTQNVAGKAVPEGAQTKESAAVGGVDLKSTTQRTLDNVNTTLKDIKDEHSAQTALPKLESAGTELDKVVRLSDQLPDAGKKAVAGVVSAAEPATSQLFDKVLAIPGVKEVAKPQIDSLRAKLNTLSKERARL